MAVSGNAIFAGYIREAGARPFAFGEADCAQFVAGWLERLSGRDPAALAPAYAGEREALALIRRHGGLKRLAAEIADRHGLVEVETPRIGDVGVVRVGRRRVLAIALGDGRWAVKTARGIAHAPLPHIVAWRHGAGQSLSAEAIGALIVMAATAGAVTASPLVATVIGTLAITAASLGAQYALSAFGASKAKARAGAIDMSAPDRAQGQQMIRQAIGARVRHYGRVKVGGTIVFSGVAAGVWHRVAVTGHGELDAIEEHWLGDQEVTVVADLVQEAPLYGYAGLRWRAGLATETGYSDLTTAFAEWTAAHRGDGLSSVWLALNDPGPENFGKVYAGGVPAYRQVARGAKVYDPRDATTAWSDNPALCVRDFLTHPDGFNLAESQIDDDSFSAFADLCDEDVAVAAGGTEKRYRLWGSYSLTEPRKDVLRRMLEACDGRIVQGGDGRFGIDGGQWSAPTIALDSSAIIAADWEFGADATQRANLVKPVYVDALADYAEVEAAAWRDEDSIAADGEIAAPLDLKMVPSQTQAQRLAKIAGKRIAAPVRGVIRCGVAGLAAWQQRIVTVDDGLVSGDFLIEKFDLSISAKSIETTLRLVEVDASHWAWDEATEEGDAPSIPESAAATAAIETPAGLSVVVQPVVIDATTTGGQLYVTWTAPTRAGMRTEIRWRNVVGGTPGAYQSSAVHLGDDGSYVLKFVTPPIANDGTTYEVQARFVTGGGAAGDWCTAATVTATADATDPGVVTSLVLTGGAGQIASTFKLPNAANVAGARVWSNTSNTLVGATLKATVYGAAGSSLSATATGLTAGTRWILVVAFNGSGVASASATSGSAVVT